jgi:protein phosphatase
MVVAGAALLLVAAAAWYRARPSLPAVDAGAGAGVPTADSAALPSSRANALVTRISVVEGSADVLLDGRVVGTTPYEHFAPAGTSVTLTLRRAGFIDEVVTFIVSNNQREYTLVLHRNPDVPVSPAFLGLIAWWRRRRAGPDTPPRASHEAVTGERVLPEAFRIQSASLTDVGCVRSENEDAVRVVHLPDGAVVATLCDGMGGHAAGEVAAALAVTAICERAATLNTSAALVMAIDAANHQIRSAMSRDAALTGMGTTCVVVCLHGQSALCAHVGDSRAYLLRGGAIYRLTEDHSHVRHLVRDGQIADHEARHHPDKNVILRALGPAEQVTATTWPAPLALRPGDRFLLSSDGLHDLADDDEFLPALASADPQLACAGLVALARERGAPDNVSVCILDVTRPTSDPKVTRTAGLDA